MRGIISDSKFIVCFGMELIHPFNFAFIEEECILDHVDWYKQNIADVLLDDPEISNEQLIKDYINGKTEVKEKLILRNIGLVRMILNQYSISILSKTSYEDLMQEGLIGLIHAIDKYDPYLSNASRFSSYAVMWIKATISKYLRNKSDIIRIPSYKYDDYQRIRGIILQLENKANREPTVLEISQEARMDCADVQNLLVLFKHVDSLDRSMSSEDDSFTLADLILDHDDAYLEIELRSYNDWLREEIDNALKNNLTLIENNIVRLRYGMDECNIVQIKEISEMFNLTSNQVITIINNAFTKLRKSSWYVKMRNLYRYENSM